MTRRATGPRTQDGKAVVGRNAITYGLFSPRPVLPGVESEDEWNDYRAALVDSLAPEGRVEFALAERAAHCLWRLRRVDRYEAQVVAGDFSHPGLDTVIRAEAHLSRQLSATLRALRALQDRRGRPTDVRATPQNHEITEQTVASRGRCK